MPPAPTQVVIQIQKSEIKKEFDNPLSANGLVLNGSLDRPYTLVLSPEIANKNGGAFPDVLRKYAIIYLCDYRNQ